MYLLEREIDYLYDTPSKKGLKEENLDISECMDINSDTDISFKLVNEDGDILTLIEVKPLNRFKDDDKKAHIGCFIHRFEYWEEILNTEPFYDFLRKFLTAVRFKMVRCNNNRFLSYYKYLWTIIPKISFSIIDDIFEFEDKIEEGDKIVLYQELE